MAYYRILSSYRVEYGSTLLIGEVDSERVRSMKISTKAKCVECSRVFDLLNDVDANEWAYGHDCEVE